MEKLKENIVIAKFGKTFQFSDNHFNDLELKNEVIDLIKEEDVFSLTCFSAKIKVIAKCKREFTIIFAILPAVIGWRYFRRYFHFSN